MVHLRKGEKGVIMGAIRRRTVYVATIVAMFAMVGGFALASFTTVALTSNQGATTTSITNSAWAAQSTDGITPGFMGAACTVATLTTTAGTPTVSAYYSASHSAQAAGNCVAGDFTEEIILQATVLSSQTVATDTFTVYSSSSAGAGIVNTVSVSVDGSVGAYTAQINLFVDYGASPPATITSLNEVTAGPF